MNSYGALKDKGYVYDIRQMLQTLKIENWHNIHPFFFFLSPLQTALDDVINELLAMKKAGVLKSRYFIEHNEVLSEKIVTMVELDMVAQWLLGNELKQVQLNFLYGVHKTLYETAARTYMVDDAKNKNLLEDAIPCMTVYKTMKNILAIQ